MLVLTRKNRESVVIGRPGELEIALEITVLEIEGGRVRLGFQADHKLPIHRREVWDRICHATAEQGNGEAVGDPQATAVRDGQTVGRDGRASVGLPPLAAALARMEGRRRGDG